MTITNGTIEFSRRIRTGDFEHKDAKVSLTFTVPEGVDHKLITEHVGNIAVERALAMVGEKPAAVSIADALPAGFVNGTKLAEPWPGPSVGKKVGVLPAGETLTPSKLADIMGPVIKVGEVPPVAPVVAAYVSGAVDIMGNGVAVNPTVMDNASGATTAPMSEPSSATVVSPSEPVITDAQMVEAIGSKNAHMLLTAAEDDLARQAVPVALHKLVAEFVPPPAKVQAIPAAKRADFLKQLAAL